MILQMTGSMMEQAIMMNELFSRLTSEQTLEVLARLSSADDESGGRFRNFLLVIRSRVPRRSP